MPTATDSSVPWANGALVSLTRSSIGSPARLIVNSCVSSTLRRVSLRPTEVNATIGGSALATVKKECGARLPSPSAESVETQAIGRGTTIEVSRE